MRLLKIGRDASCDIVLHSNKVSALHAEMTILNNGDILLEDKNSRNGTFVMNMQIQPNTSISVKKGDAIRFADVELSWNMIPPPEDNSQFKALYGIGTNFMNDIRIVGNTASRFHATLKIGKNGKSYIQDHSKNGTTVNGQKIAFGQNVRIKRSDSIVCGGIPVDLKPYIQSSNWIPYVGGGIVAAVVIPLVIWLIQWFKVPDLNALQNATACVYGEFYIEVVIKDDPLVGKIDDWPSCWRFGIDENGRIAMANFNNKNVRPIPYTGTGFFISEYGDLGTNRHVAVPWKELPKYNREAVLGTMEKFINDGSMEALVAIYDYSSDSETTIARIKKSELIIEGSHTFLGIALKGTKVRTEQDMLPCQVIAESESEDKDVALIRLNNRTTPEKIIEDGYFELDNARLDETKLTTEESLITMGYPAGFKIGFVSAKSQELLPTVHKVNISKKPDQFNFQFQGNTLGGQSGSPIIDEDHHRLVGVLFASIDKTDISYACNIKHLIELYNKNKIEE